MVRTAVMIESLMYEEARKEHSGAERGIGKLVASNEVFRIVSPDLVCNHSRLPPAGCARSRQMSEMGCASVPYSRVVPLLGLKWRVALPRDLLHSAIGLLKGNGSENLLPELLFRQALSASLHRILVTVWHTLLGAEGARPGRQLKSVPVSGAAHLGFEQRGLLGNALVWVSCFCKMWFVA